MNSGDELRTDAPESEDESSGDDDSNSPERCGTLQKWTNYIHGWQDRYFVLKDGCLSYFKEKAEVATGSRGSISLAKALVKENEFDELRFDIGINDSIWYCRAKDREERKSWLDAIELHKNDSGIGSTLSRNGSMFSLNSISSGNLGNGSSFKNKRNKAQELKTLTSEIETLRNLSNQLMGKLENHLANTSLQKSDGDLSSCHEYDVSLFRADCLTFRTTTDHLLELAHQCVEVSLAQDDKLRARYERELEKRKKFEEFWKTSQRRGIDGPDLQEGPHSTLTDENWFDAVDVVLDDLDKESQKQEINWQNSLNTVKVPLTYGTQRTRHRFSEACDTYVKENLKYAFSSTDLDNDGWELMHSEGEMRVYRKEVEIDGVVCDPLKATHQVDGITAEEMCRWFYDPDYKMEWEGHLLDKVKVLEILSPDTAIIQSVMKRVWPSAQRDMVYLSHIRHVSAFERENNQNDTWIVCNYSVDHPDGHLGRGVVRCNLRSSMVCQTTLKQELPNSTPETRYSREKVACKVWYTADVNPGGWAPAKVLRQIYKHEYPKFLTKFGSYVYSKSEPLNPLVTIPMSLCSNE